MPLYDEKGNMMPGYGTHPIATPLGGSVAPRPQTTPSSRPEPSTAVAPQVAYQQSAPAGISV